MDLILIGEKIKKLRVVNNMTQEELANKLYVTKQAVSKWENAICLPDIENIEKICEIFKIKIDDLLSENIVNQ